MSDTTTSTSITTRSEAETIELAARSARSLAPGDVVALHGELGAGKTRFVKGLAIGLGHDPNGVNSPTFVLVHLYDSEGATPLAHVDAYRLAAEDDLAALGWDRIVDGTRVVAIEWAERIADDLPAHRFDVHLAHAGAPDERSIRIDAPPGRGIDLA